MSDNEPLRNNRGLVLSETDIRRATAQGVLAERDADSLLRWAYDQRFNLLTISEVEPPSPEQRKGFNLVTVLYYFGAMLRISAWAWFLGDKWKVLGPSGICITVIIYMTGLVSLGVWLRRRGFFVGGGLLITVAVALTPLVVYTIEKMTGLWPAEDPGAYKDFYPLIHASWIGMELSTIAVALVAIWFVRFSFLTAPMAFCFWFLSMDLAALLYGQNFLDHKRRDWISVAIGLLTMMVGYVIQQVLRRRKAPVTEDFAFWSYLFGLMAFWFGLTALEHAESEPRRLIYFVANIGLMAIAVKSKRVTFMVFGAIGAYIYLGHLTWEVFKDSVFFPFVIAAFGLSMILLTVLGQKWIKKPRAQTANA